MAMVLAVMMVVAALVHVVQVTIRRATLAGGDDRCRDERGRDDRRSYNGSFF